ncbi:MAG TPA: S1 RNA-binding domain-containing protein [Candidatus Dojkabacteria bacterium]|jgi:small subunit ribosomal protein S1
MNEIKKDTQALKSLEDYVNGLNNPPKVFNKGDITLGTIVEMGTGYMLVDIGGRAEGVVAGREMKLNGEKLDKKIGDSVLVYVVKGENEKGQIEISIRRTGTARKWHDLEEAQNADKSVEVTVLEANTGGVIVDIGGGLRGFIPTSQLDNTRIYPLGGFNDKSDASKQLQNKLAGLIGEKIESKVIEIDKEKNRVILSEKLVTSSADLEKREETLKKSGAGDILEGEVTGIAPFGLFVNAEGLEGLVHLSEISWDKVSNPADFFNVGDKVKVQIIGIDDGGKRIAYSIKRLQQDPWEDIIKKYKVGQMVEGEVTKVVDYGAFVRIEDGLNGLIHISELSDKLVKDPGNIVKLGQKLSLQIISISKEERHLGLSLKRTTSKASDSSEKDIEEKKESGVAPELAELEKLLENEDM